MKIIKQKSKKTLIIIIAAAVVLLTGSSAFAYFNKLGPFSSSQNPNVNTKAATKEQQDAGQQVKQEKADEDAKSKPSGSDQPAAPVPQPSGKSTVTVSITAANQNSGMLQIRNLIEAVDSTGTCTLTLTKSGSTTVTKTAGVQALASSSTCQGFNIPVSELSKGTWNIDLLFENSTLKGTASKTVDIQ